MKGLIILILSITTLTGSTFASGGNPYNRQVLRAVSANYYNKKVDYNWYGWQNFNGDIEIGEGYVVLPDGKGRFDLNTDPIDFNTYVSRKYVSYQATNENGEHCKISITCFVDGNCIVVVCYDQKSWAYKCSEPITFDFKPTHVGW